jgi:hypothetical protein
MKVQTGIRIETELWQNYRELCRRQNQLPSRPIEDFLELTLENNSALGTLNLLREASKTQINGLEAYARVLLDWYTHDKFWIPTIGEEESVEFLLLEALKTVTDRELAQQIEQALIAEQHRRQIKEKR